MMSLANTLLSVAPLLRSRISCLMVARGWGIWAMRKVLSAIRRRGLRSDAMIDDQPSWHLYLFLAVFSATLLAAFVLPFFG